jgi:hypothetical protein
MPVSKLRDSLVTRVAVISPSRRTACRSGTRSGCASARIARGSDHLTTRERVGNRPVGRHVAPSPPWARPVALG